MLEVIKFHPSHLFAIETMFSFDDVSRKAMSNHTVAGGYTLCEGETIIGCGGVHKMWHGNGEGWLLMSTHAYKMPKTVARYTYRLFDTIMADNNLWRIQASVHATDEQSIRFAEWMGFENEGLMKKFGPDGSDYYRFARVA